MYHLFDLQASSQIYHLSHMNKLSFSYLSKREREREGMAIAIFSLLKVCIEENHGVYNGIIHGLNKPHTTW